MSNNMLLDMNNMQNYVQRNMQTNLLNNRVYTLNMQNNMQNDMTKRKVVVSLIGYTENWGQLCVSLWQFVPKKLQEFAAHQSPGHAAALLLSGISESAFQRRMDNIWFCKLFFLLKINAKTNSVMVPHERVLCFCAGEVQKSNFTYYACYAQYCISGIFFINDHIHTFYILFCNFISLCYIFLGQVPFHHRI